MLITTCLNLITLITICSIGRYFLILFRVISSSSESLLNHSSLQSGSHHILKLEFQSGTFYGIFNKKEPSGKSFEQFSGFGCHIYKNDKQQLRIFIGQIQQGKFHKGTQFFEFNERYEGQFKNGARNGKGKYFFEERSLYEGQWVNDNKHGYGKKTYANGDLYEGEYINNYRQGQGKFTFSNGEVYQGQWKKNNRHGFGTLSYQNMIFEGNFINNQINGSGKLYLKRKVKILVYDGQWKGNKRNGNGIYYYGQNERYQGEWLNNMKHGKGRYQYQNGDVFMGSFHQDKKVGEGVYNYANACGKYQGPYKEDKRAGIASLEITLNNKKQLIHGQFRSGRLNGKARHIFDSRNPEQYYQGEFVNNQFSGSGCYYWKDLKCSGYFQNCNPSGVMTISQGNSFYLAKMQDGIFKQKI